MHKLSCRHWLFIHTLVESIDSISGWWRSCSDCTDAQADLGLHCPCILGRHFLLGTPNFVLYRSIRIGSTRSIRIGSVILSDVTDWSLLYWFLHQCIYLTLVPLNPDISCLSKQCRSRSVGFYLDMQCLPFSSWICQQPGSSNLIGWKLEVGVAS